MISPVSILFMPSLFSVSKNSLQTFYYFFLGSPPNIITSTYPGISQEGKFSSRITREVRELREQAGANVSRIIRVGRAI
jgi:type IV pilus biogenesis protein CpaD/CtpE